MQDPHGVSPQVLGAASRHAHADQHSRSLEAVRPRPAPRAARRPVPAPRSRPAAGLPLGLEEVVV